MATTFDVILRHLEKYDLRPNQAPPLLVHGGVHYPVDLSDQTSYNRQILLIAYELKNSEGDIALRNIEHYNKEQLDVDYLLYKFEDLIDLESVLDSFSNHFGIVLDKGKVIRRLPQRSRDTYFYLFVAVLQQPYYG